MPLLIQAAEAVNVLHTAEVPIAHLDVKPDNFLINDKEGVELCDFGLSRILNGAPSGLTTGAGGGTYAFQAPEYMLDGTKYSKSLDLFSFGSSILTILSGELPFKRASNAMIITKVTAGQKPQQAEYQIPFTAPVSDAIWKLMNKCWDSEPDNRPTMTEVIQELRRISSLEGGTTE
ncbi:hypothetical protein FS837_012872 [Tulasnella sp. UAMH 9824]|nr:hypothetical protein FS837_012872 [Tulasnella sp. UAMH 9824]